MPVFQAILFDFDGVIIDSEALHNAAVAAAVARRGVSVPDALFEEFMGTPDAALLDYINRRYWGGRYSVEELLAEKQAAFLEVADQVRPIPGALEFIQRARPHFRSFALATSALRVNQQLIFDRLDLHRFFDAVVTADDVAQPKPAPEPYLLAAERIGLPTGACVVIEDSLNGVRAGKGAGCQVIGLTTSLCATQLTEAGADLVCNSFEEIAAHLLRPSSSRELQSLLEDR
ncbi:MAG: HAD family phosphatase [Caldilinea sp.]|uniref:HAD family hydrolase n=1 Tax=Caldilinea sp. TaxID=2293560 RepID=UPI0030AC80CD